MGPQVIKGDGFGPRALGFEGRLIPVPCCKTQARSQSLQPWASSVKKTSGCAPGGLLTAQEMVTYCSRIQLIHLHVIRLCAAHVSC